MNDLVDNSWLTLTCQQTKDRFAVRKQMILMVSEAEQGCEITLIDPINGEPCSYCVDDDYNNIMTQFNINHKPIKINSNLNSLITKMKNTKRKTIKNVKDLFLDDDKDKVFG